MTILNQGWQCPGCKMIYAPTQTKCACQATNAALQERIGDYIKPFTPNAAYGAGGIGARAGYDGGGGEGWAYLNQKNRKDTL